MITDNIRAMDDIDAVRDGRETWQRVIAVAGVLKAVSITGVIVLLVTTIFVISNAIRLTLYARRREIRIMQLVGATNHFIRMPLVVEGMVFGAVGAVIAWLLLKAGATYIAHVVQSITPILGQFTSEVTPVRLALGMLIMGALIGAAGSLVSIRRFLRD
jgi:cell division transport system permease protein